MLCQIESNAGEVVVASPAFDLNCRLEADIYVKMLDADIASSIFNYLRTYLNSCPFLKRLYCLCKPTIPLPVRTNHKAKNKDLRKAGMEPLAKSAMARTIAKGANTNISSVKYSNNDVNKY